jgi:hypothetical protein
MYDEHGDPRDGVGAGVIAVLAVTRALGVGALVTAARV